MKHNWLKRIGGTLLMLLVVVGLFFAYATYCWKGLFGDTEIKKGFSPELLENLQTRYGITVPEEAKFIKGYNTGGPDNSVVIFFECPLKDTWRSDNKASIYNYMVQLLKLDCTSYGMSHNSRPRGDWTEDRNAPMDYTLTDNRVAYTEISFNIEADKLIIRFFGWRPGATFR